MTELLSWLVWPCIVSLPLMLTTADFYKKIFPSTWYDEFEVDYWNHPERKLPLPLGLTLGILAVVVGQIFTLLYFCLRRYGKLGTCTSVQKEGAVKYELSEGMLTHLGQPEGFIMLGGYLIGTWMLGLMPASYYSFTGGINWFHVLLQLLIQDFLQYLMHIIEHKASPAFYKMSHKPHHRFTNPRLFDAFNGSPTDTFVMIMVPLFITAHLVQANVWSYMAFGSLYANWLTLIHSEYIHAWEWLFYHIGFGTAADHHVHHKMFIYNFAHLFMYWDVICGTHRNPTRVKLFNTFDESQQPTQE